MLARNQQNLKTNTKILKSQTPNHCTPQRSPHEQVVGCLCGEASCLCASGQGSIFVCLISFPQVPLRQHRLDLMNDKKKKKSPHESCFPVANRSRYLGLDFGAAPIAFHVASTTTVGPSNTTGHQRINERQTTSSCLNCLQTEGEEGP